MKDFIFNTFTWTVIGFVVAYVSHLFRWDSRRGGILSTIVFGLTGAFFGGMLANVFLGQTTGGFSLPGILFAFVALLILATLQKLFLEKPRQYDDTFYYLGR